MDITKLAEEIIAGRRLQRGEDLSFFIDCDLQELMAGADKIREHYCGNHVDLCTIVNGRSGRCPENCKYCAQSAHNHSKCEVYDFLGKEEILANALANEAEGVNRYSIVTAGRGWKPQEFEKVLDAFRELKAKCRMSLCASMGFLTEEQFHQLKEVGVSRYHDNIETSKRNFPNICTTHTYEGKIETIKAAQRAGLTVCSGGIIGMGETWEDRIDMAISLFELGILSIPLNSLIPIPGTALEHLEQLPEEDILRTVALFRYINPEAHIRMAAGRALIKSQGKGAFQGGASAAITGNMLTTTASTIISDKAMLLELGRDVTPDYEKNNL